VKPARSWRGSRISQGFSVSKTDIKSFIVISGWIADLIVTMLVAFGWINPPPDSLQATLVTAMVNAFITVTTLALGAYLWGKAKTS